MGSKPPDRVVYVAAVPIAGRVLSLAAGEPVPSEWQDKTRLRQLGVGLGVADAMTRPFDTLGYVRAASMRFDAHGRLCEVA